MTYTVYLAGPIKGLLYDVATTWREEFKRALDPRITALSPMRGKEYLLGTQPIADAYSEHVLSTGKAIVSRDSFDVRRADVLVVNLLGAAQVSIGTMFELAWAHQQHTPIVLVMEPGNVHDHAFVREVATFRMDTLEQARAVAEHILLPDHVGQ